MSASCARMTPSSWQLMLPLVFVAFVLQGCSGDDDDPEYGATSISFGFEGSFNLDLDACCPHEDLYADCCYFNTSDVQKCKTNDVGGTWKCAGGWIDDGEKYLNCHCDQSTSTCVDCAVDAMPIDGRAYTVSGEPIRASATTDATCWGESCSSMKLDTLKWRNVALAEHASVASFARAVLHLMALGAPPALVDETLQAARDEVAHARAAFALAGASPGPLPLAQDSTPLALPLQEVVQLVFTEGCLHETRAVLRAAVDIRSADGEVRDFLAMVLVDERKHAELAWRTVHWGLSLGAKLTLPALSPTLATDGLIVAIAQDLSQPDFDMRLRRHFDVALARTSDEELGL